MLDADVDVVTDNDGDLDKLKKKFSGYDEVGRFLMGELTESSGSKVAPRPSPMPQRLSDTISMAVGAFTLTNWRALCANATRHRAAR